MDVIDATTPASPGIAPTANGAKTKVRIRGFQAHAHSASCDFDIAGSSATVGGQIVGYFVNASSNMSNSYLIFDPPESSGLRVYNITVHPPYERCLGGAVSMNGSPIALEYARFDVVPASPSLRPLLINAF